LASQADPSAKPRAPLSRDRVLSAAVSLADEGGIESLTMRKLAQKLGVEAMTLYYYVANKDDILNGIVDVVVSEIEAPARDPDWKAALRKSAISAHEVLLHHPWACGLMMSPPRVRPARLRFMDSVLRSLWEAGFSAELTYLAYHAFDSHILGFTLWEVGYSTGMAEPPNFIPNFLETLPAEYPYLAQHAEQHLTGSSHHDEGEFEFGLDLILDGFEKMRGMA
jgi:AcrR family transcriptional regulator